HREDQTEDQREPGEDTSQHREKKMASWAPHGGQPRTQAETPDRPVTQVKKAFTPDHVVYARSKTAVYRCRPFTFHVKKNPEGAVEVVQCTEMVEGVPGRRALHEVTGRVRLRGGGDRDSD
uniref:Uncharacterized protein n=1 Tax=Sphaeramia orbicularis TaxID=375764 RepID=A0A672YRY7_9TELE